MLQNDDEAAVEASVVDAFNYVSKLKDENFTKAHIYLISHHIHIISLMTEEY